jgi:hypothetical protein
MGALVFSARPFPFVASDELPFESALMEPTLV